MWGSLRSQIARGGRLAYLGGNGFIWRRAMSNVLRHLFDAEPFTMSA